jgi:hypothetical protein
MPETADALVPALPEQVPPVRVGELHGESIAAAIAPIVERGVQRRPELASVLEASVLLTFPEGYTPVRIDFRGHEIVVSDTTADDMAHDLAIEGRLPDVIALITAPLAGGLPRPTTSGGRAAIARLADGRVDFTGSLRTARSVIRLLALRD